MNAKSNKWLKYLSRVAIWLGVLYLIFLLGRSVWTNVELRGSILKLQQQIAFLEEQKRELADLILYYKSDSFKELEARKKLGLKKPDEKMIILPAATSSPALIPDTFSEELIKEKEGIVDKNPPNMIPNWLLWWQYLTE